MKLVLSPLSRRTGGGGRFFFGGRAEGSWEGNGNSNSEKSGGEGGDVGYAKKGALSLVGRRRVYSEAMYGRQFTPLGNMATCYDLGAALHE